MPDGVAGRSGQPGRLIAAIVLLNAVLGFVQEYRAERHSAVKRAAVRVLVATDGSRSAWAALATARAFPWPETTRARGVVVSPFDWLRTRSPRVRRAFTQTFERLAGRARHAIGRRWPHSDVVMVSGRPAEAILREARRFGAHVIVFGWRGHGTFRRLLMGSVSRDVVARARCAVLVVRRPVRQLRRIVIGVDGSTNAGRAVDLVARLRHEQIEIIVVRVVEPQTVLTAAGLERAGWTVRADVRTGAPLAGLLDVVNQADADLLVVGARATSGLKRALLGSVAAGALAHSRVPVLVVR